MQPFVALDFETANRYRQSACSIGLVKFDENGEKSGEYYTLIHPHEQFNFFDPTTVRIHGIHASDVEASPQWSDINDELLEFTQDLPIVAHNMPFDGSVINSLTELYNTHSWDMPRLCTLKLSRNLLKGQLNSFGLEPVYNYFVPKSEFDHHNALADAFACGKIFAKLQEQHDFEALSDVMAHGAKSIYTKQAHHAQTVTARKSTSAQENPRIDRTKHYKMPYISKKAAILRGAQIVLVGSMSYGSRSRVESLIASLGGRVFLQVSSHTTLVVIGADVYDYDDTNISRAQELQRAGASIALVNEDEFFRGLKEVAGEFS